MKDRNFSIKSTLMLGYLCSIFTCRDVYALTPLEGIIKGDVTELEQYDPLKGILDIRDAFQGDISLENKLKLKKYKFLYDQGIGMQTRCEYATKPRFQNLWDELTAKRTVIANLQYIGLDITLKAIGAYAKEMQMEYKNYTQLVDNLIKNTCSQNMTLYSRNFLRKNFLRAYEQQKTQLPVLRGNNLFTDNFQKSTASVSAKEREFEMTVRSFRSFCSWGTDAQDLRLLVPYLTNPFIMGSVFNFIQEKRMSWDSLQGHLQLESSPAPYSIGCYSTLCRPMKRSEFLKNYPKRIGSTDMREDLEDLYCHYFREARFSKKSESAVVDRWLAQRTAEETFLEVGQFYALLTGVSDLLLSADQYDQIGKGIKESLLARWDAWANEKNEDRMSNLFYEEGLNLKLIPQRLTQEVLQGDFSIHLSYSSGEYDKTLAELDKLSAKFHLKFSNKYLNWIRSRYVELNNIEQTQAVDSLLKRVASDIEIQLKNVDAKLYVQMWNENFSSLLAKELLEQLSLYRGGRLRDLGHKEVSIPVNLEYSLFALNFLHKKFAEQYR